jgi:hypothetical protein
VLAQSSDGSVLTERFARRRASAGDDYACERRSPPWGRHPAHRPLHVVSGENLVWVSWTDDRGGGGLGLGNLLGGIVF